MTTIFTRIITGDLPGTFVHRDDDLVVFMTINPISPGHALVVPVAGAFEPPAELEPAQVRALGLPVVTTAESASVIFPGAQGVTTPWAALPTLFATTDLLRAEAKPEALNPAATYATWDGERHRGPA